MLVLFCIILAMIFLGIGNTFKVLFAILFAAVGAAFLYFLGYTLLLSLLA
jgi:hypothetical protein